MSGQFEKIFFTSLSSRIDNKQAMLEMEKEFVKELTPAAFHRLVATRVLSQYLSALDEALKDYNADKNPKPSQSSKSTLYYVKKEGGAAEPSAAETLSVEIHSLLKLDAPLVLTESGQVAAYTKFRDGVGGLITKLSTLEFDSEVEEKEASLAAYNVKSKLSHFSELEDSADVSKSTAAVAAFGQFALGKLDAMASLTAQAYLKFGGSLSSVMLSYSHDLMGQLKDQAQVLHPIKDRGCVLM